MISSVTQMVETQGHGEPKPALGLDCRQYLLQWIADKGFECLRASVCFCILGSDVAGLCAFDGVGGAGRWPWSHDIPPNRGTLMMASLHHGPTGVTRAMTAITWGCGRRFETLLPDWWRVLHISPQRREGSTECEQWSSMLLVQQRLLLTLSLLSLSPLTLPWAATSAIE